MIRFIADVVRLYRGERVEKQRAARKAEEVVREGAAPDWNESFRRASTATFLVSAKLQPLRKWKFRAGALTPGVMLVWLNAHQDFSISSSGWRS